MKRFLSLALTALLCLGMLGGCGSKPQTPAPTAAPTATPEPPSTVPDPTPAPTETPSPAPTEAPTPEPVERNGLLKLLDGVFDEYHSGTAGSSLRAAWYAASLTDWCAQNGPDSVRLAASGWDRGTLSSQGEDLREKLCLMYSTALALLGSYRDVLSDAGYTAPWSYEARTVHQGFKSLFQGLGMEPPTMLAVWYPDYSGERFNVAAADVTEISVESINAAMTDYDAVNGGAGIGSIRVEGDTVYADMNLPFYQMLAVQGSAGEHMLIGSVVNTLLDAYGAGSVVLTFDGGYTIETGHDVYDYPLTRFGDNVG